MKTLLLITLLTTNLLFATWTDINELPSATQKRKVENINTVEALKSIGFSEELANNYHKVIRAEQPIVIIDGGFKGLNAFLKKHPEKNKNIIKWINLYKDAKDATTSHGFDVFTSALATSPEAKFYLIQFDLNDDTALEKILKFMKKANLHLANYSIGSPYFLGESKKHERKLHKLLAKYEITFFKTIGNSRNNSHYFKYSDLNNNKVLEFINPDNKFNKHHEYNPIKIYKNENVYIRLYWHMKDNDDIKNNIELRLYNKKGKVLATSKKTKFNFVRINYKALQSEIAFIRIIDKGLKNKNDKYFTLEVEGAKNDFQNSYFNGFGIAGLETFIDSPFIISIGSYGKGEDNKLTPSNFSSYSKTYDGKVLPHILGPGQLIIDGKKINGTSFASPFISGYYAKFNGYNLKNFVESTSTKENFSSGVKEIEKGRWGIPNVMALHTSSCLDSDVIENIKQKNDETNITLTFDFSRKCMEGLSYRLFVKLFGTEINKGVKKSIPIDKYYRSAVFKSDRKNIDKQSVEIKIPLKDLQKDFHSTKVTPQFFIAIRSSSYIPLKGKIDNTAIKVPGTSEKISILKVSQYYSNRNENEKSLKLVDKIIDEKLLDLEDQNWHNLKLLKLIKVRLLLRMNQYNEANEILINLSKDMNKDFRYYDFYLKMRIALLYANKEYQKVIDEISTLRNQNHYDSDLSVLEYFSNIALNNPKEFVSDNSEDAKLIDKYLRKEIDFVYFNNSLLKYNTKTDDLPKEYTSTLVNFINMQLNFTSKNPQEKKYIISNAKNLFKSNYIDSIYYIIAKMQLGIGAKTNYKSDKSVSNSYNSISVKDKHGNIYKTVKSPYTNRIWLDRNLGAKQVCTSINDKDCIGDYFQWGRDSDGHEKVNSIPTSRPNSFFDNLSDTEIPEHKLFILSNKDLDYKWLEEHNYNLWQGVNGKNNPCPKGFRVPLYKEILKETIEQNIKNEKAAYNSFLKLPASGSRSWLNGKVYYKKTYLWASDIKTFKNYSDKIYQGFNFEENRTYSADGLPIRCIKD